MLIQHCVNPKSNAERQRRFRERNPTYYARLQATKRASNKCGLLRMMAAMQQAEADRLAGQPPADSDGQLLLPWELHAPPATAA
ncbi:MAG TPA: hypothetical protein VF595_14360 [Tepidisphaeraceae bacterium]|jgi:hypothetical protein